MFFAKKISSIVLVSLFLFLTGCGAAHVKTDIQSQKFTQYDNILIQSVKVYSKEVSAKDNQALQEKLRRWQSFASGQIQEYVRDSKFTPVASLRTARGATLLLDLDVDVQYGNRALRWAVGFGAGKGGVYSVLTIKDARTGEIVYKSQADSDLSVGAAGGDIGSVLESNIKKLIAELKMAETS